MAILMTMLGQTVGFPVPEGGAGELSRALARRLEARGGEVRCGIEVIGIDVRRGRATGVRARGGEPFAARHAVVADVAAPHLYGGLVAAADLPDRTLRAMRRFQMGPGTVKVDWALSGPVPWEAPPCREAGTVHLGGTLAEVARSEADVNAGRHPERPYCLVAQPGVVDPTRAPAGRHTLWGYCHVPSGSAVDMSGRIEAQIERFAPGFRDLILARSVKTAVDMERYNPNYVGGDINSGAGTLLQTFFRPTPRWNPYRTPLPGVYLCGASTAPGGGVHGMCGEGAARAALADLAVKAPR
jgi:phytoene dehydrogenase-like protein